MRDYCKLNDGPISYAVHAEGVHIHSAQVEAENASRPPTMTAAISGCSCRCTISRTVEMRQDIGQILHQGIQS